MAYIAGHTGHFLGSGEVEVGVGGVKRVFAELLAQFGHAFLNFGKARACLAGEFGAAEHKVAHRVFVGLALFGVQAGWVHGLVFGVQALVGAQTRPKFGDQGQGGVVGGAQLGAVGHAVEVADRAPGHAEFFVGSVQSGGHGGPLGGKFRCRHGFERCLGLGQQLLNGRGHVLGPDLVKQRRGRRHQQRVVHALRSADSRVLTSSMVMVMGPTPPGTGVMWLATWRTPS